MHLHLKGGVAMCRENSSFSYHGQHHHHGENEHSHPHEKDDVAAPSLSPRDRLIIRLQHSIRHNRDHAETYRSMAEEAREIGAQEAARWIRDAADQSDRQTEELEKALATLKKP
jgi:rubrerythrin